MIFHVTLILTGLLWVGITVGLLVAAIQDIKHREIEDKVWGFMLLFLFPLLLSRGILEFTFLDWIYWGLNAFFGIVTGFVLFYFGAWGGADSKALMAISLLWPFQTIFTPTINTLGPFPIIGLLTNMIIFMLGTVIWFIGYNAYFKVRTKSLFKGLTASPLMKIIALISCYPVKMENAKHLVFALPAETLEEGRRKLAPGIFALEDEEQTEHQVLLRYLQELQEQQQTRENTELRESLNVFPYIWVRPMPPGIVFLLLGWIWYSILLSPINMLLAILTR